jgi:peptidoglycan/xylan/chitin deacetylase (PgdA/CDA1 family)
MNLIERLNKDLLLGEGDVSRIRDSISARYSKESEEYRLSVLTQLLNEIIERNLSGFKNEFKAKIKDQIIKDNIKKESFKISKYDLYMASCAHDEDEDFIEQLQSWFKKNVDPEVDRDMLENAIKKEFIKDTHEDLKGYFENYVERKEETVRPETIETVDIEEEQDEVDKLNREKKYLKNSLRGLKEEREELKEEIFNLNKEIFRLTANSEDILDTYDGTLNEIKELDSKKEEKRSEIYQINQEISGLNSEKVKLARQVEKFNKDIIACKEEREELKKELFDMNKEIFKQKDQILKGNEEWYKLEDVIERFRKDKEVLKREIYSLTQEKEWLTADIEDSQKGIGEIMSHEFEKEIENINSFIRVKKLQELEEEEELRLEKRRNRKLNRILSKIKNNVHNGFNKIKTFLKKIKNKVLKIRRKESLEEVEEKEKNESVNINNINEIRASKKANIKKNIKSVGNINIFKKYNFSFGKMLLINIAIAFIIVWGVLIFAFVNLNKASSENLNQGTSDTTSMNNTINNSDGGELIPTNMENDIINDTHEGIIDYSKNGIITFANEIPILIYHHIVEMETKQENAETIIDKEIFEKQMKYLFLNGYKTLTLEELKKFLARDLKVPEKTVMITFDDGYESIYKYAYPIMKKYDFKGTAFLIGSSIKSKNSIDNIYGIPKISYEEMMEMKDVFTFGSHTYNLHKLKNQSKSILVDAENNESILLDFLKSKSVIDDKVFSYPYGQFDRNLVNIVERAGFEMAFTTEENKVKPGDEILELGRISINSRYTFEEFTQIVTP